MLPQEFQVCYEEDTLDYELRLRCAELAFNVDRVFDLERVKQLYDFVKGDSDKQIEEDILARKIRREEYQKSLEVDKAVKEAIEKHKNM